MSELSDTSILESRGATRRKRQKQKRTGTHPLLSSKTHTPIVVFVYEKSHDQVRICMCVVQCEMFSAVYTEYKF